MQKYKEFSESPFFGPPPNDIMDAISRPMPPLRPVLTAFVATTALLLPSAPASAAVLLNEEMTRASRTAAPEANGAQWFSIGPGATVSYVPNELKVTHATGGGA